MDVSSFKMTRGAITSTVVPMPAGAAPPALPPSMVSQNQPTAVELEGGAAPAEAPAVAEVESSAAPATETATAEQAAQPAAEAPVDPVAQLEPTPEPVVEQPRVDPKFSALARKEAQLFREREEIKAQKAAIETAHRQVAAFEEARQAARLNPMAALEALGLSYDDLTEHVLNGGKPTANAEVAAVREELAQLRAEQEAVRAKAEEVASQRLAAEQAAVIEDARQTAVAFVEANASRYELTTVNNGASLVPQVREQHFAQTGKLLTIEQAAELVEKHFEQLADRVATAQKFRAKFEQTTRAAPPAQAATPPAAQRTLSNEMTASASVAPPKARTEADRIRAALARLEGK